MAYGDRLDAVNSDTDDRKDFSYDAEISDNNPRGVWGNVDHIYIARSDGARVESYTQWDLSYDATASVVIQGGGVPSGADGIWAYKHTGNDFYTLYALSDGQRKVFRYNLSTGSRLTGDFTLPSNVGDSFYQYRDVFGDGTYLYVFRYDANGPEDPTVLAYNLSTRSRDVRAGISSSLLRHPGLSISAETHDIRGMCMDPDGQRMFAIRTTTAPNTVSVFRRRPALSGSPWGRNPDEDFLLEDRHGFDMWSDGATLWVDDPSTNTMKAYDVLLQGPREDTIFDIVKEMLLGSKWIGVDSNDDTNRLRIRRKG